MNIIDDYDFMIDTLEGNNVDKLKALIIGCGSIGALKPDKYDYPGGENILTHAHAYNDHPDIERFYVCDTDQTQEMHALCKWNCDKLIHGEQVDIVSLCVPTKYHLEALYNIFNSGLKPKIIIAEKPFGIDSKQAIAMEQTQEKHGFKFIVDYIRRFDTTHRSIAKMLNDNEFGKIHNCRVIYNRGLKHEACHAIDLCNLFFGSFINGAASLNGDDQTIFEKDGDPSYTCILDFEKCHSVIFTPSDGRDYSIFEIDIITEKGRIVFNKHGLNMDLYDVIKEPVYGNYNTLNNVCANIKTNLNKSLYELVDNAVGVIENPYKKIHCTAEDAIAVHEIYEFLTQGG